MRIFSGRFLRLEFETPSSSIFNLRKGRVDFTAMGVEATSSVVLMSFMSQPIVPGNSVAGSSTCLWHWYIQHRSHFCKQGSEREALT